MTTIDKTHIERRVEDWKKRLADLYASVDAELSGLSDIRIEKNRSTLMHEELMQKYGVSSERLPILDIYKRNKLAATFKPVGLWVIGANGRVDILTSQGSYILVDKAEYGDNPQWFVYSPKNRRTGKPFDSAFIRETLRAV